MQDAIDKAIELERRTQALRTSQRDMSVAFAEGRAQIKEYNMVAEDVTRSLEDRLEAAQKAIDIEKDLMAERQRIATEERDIAKEKAAQSDSSEEDLDNLAALEVALINIRTESAEMQTTLGNKLNIISQQSAAAAKTEADAVVAAEKEKQEAYDATYEAKQKANAQTLKDAETAGEYLMSKRELEAQALMFEYEDLEEAQAKKVALLEESATAYPGELKLQKQILEDIETEYNRRSLDLTKKFADEDQAILDTASDKKIATAQATAQAVKAANMGLVQAGFQALNAMAKTEEGQKRLAIAQILVNQGIAMSAAIRTALTAAAMLPQPAGMFAVPGFTASLIGMVLSSFASIKGVMNQAGASSGSVGSVGGGGGGGSSAGMQLGLTPNLEGVTQVQEAMPPVKAFVVQSQLADESALVAQLKAMASL
jgi:chemotaxis protein histidine kinase CheA